MKKISLFIMSIFAVGVTLAQTVDDFSFLPMTSDNTGSIVFPDGTLSDFVGGQVMAFVDGTPVSSAVIVDAAGASRSRRSRSIY